jgi:hypothetical protein
VDFNAAANAIKREPGGRLGGPGKVFEQVGRDTFITALSHGLLPDHTVLDFGAGCLRLGYWFVRFLDARNYYAIEPNVPMLEAGKKHLFGPDILRDKSPHFYVSDKCDMTAFRVPFDFVIARSILSHASGAMLHKIFEEFAKCAAPAGIMLASYFAANGDKASTKSGECGDEMPRDKWGWSTVVKFTLGYLQSAAREYGLSVQEVMPDSPSLNEQIWLKISPAKSDETMHDDQAESRSRSPESRA